MRNGLFTSSSIHLLTSKGTAKDSFGKPALTYIAEKRMEIRLGRSLNSDKSSRPTSWGNLVEQRVFDLLPMDYKYQSDERYKHETLPFSGAPDMITDTKVCDIKCPFTLKSFCEQVDTFKDWEDWKALKPEYYWQLVSNAILTEKNIGEIIIYCPYKSELLEIREMCANYLGDQNKIAWVNWASDDELPYLKDGGYYKNINIMSFEIPDEDKEFLINRIKLATEKLEL